jgi:hypothetical protein
MSCRSVASWLHRDPESLDESERLVLEEHLETCERCRTARAQLAAVRRIGTSLPGESIGPRGHARAIARALMEGPRAAAPTRRRVPWWAFAIAGAGAAAAATIAAVSLRSDGAGTSSPSPRVGPAPPEQLSHRVVPPAAQPEPAPMPEVALVEGTLVRDGVALSPRSELPADVTLRAPQSARIVSYGVSVVVAADSEIRRGTVEHSLVLLSGKLDVDGDSMSPVLTDRFRVEVTGAVTITPRSVAVHRGWARIVGSDGKLIVARLVAGDSWKLPEVGVARPSAVTLLAQAHDAFTARDYARAEKLADAALDASPTHAQTAEARTIAAECSHARGALDEALARYQTIASHFADLPAGETALFSAARLEASRGRTDSARALFQRYLDQFSSGRFALDAKRELAKPR